MATFTPRSEEEVRACVLDHHASGRTIEVLGRGSKRGWGRAVDTDSRLDLSSLAGITLYEPDELVIAARTGTPLAEVEDMLAEHGQELAFEPPDAGLLCGSDCARGTIGGLLATNMSGPRRIKAGAMRDHVLGMRAVSGWGQAFKSGGRVVKNVTGYDLSRGLSGSWGTLAVFTEATFRVLPRSETSRTIAVAGLSDADGVDLLCRAMGSAWEVSGAAHVPARLVGLLPAPMLSGEGRSVTLIRIEGVEPSVDYRGRRLLDLVGADREAIAIDDGASRSIWRFVRDAGFFTRRSDTLWRVSVPPGEAASFVAVLSAFGRIRHFYDWSGGLVWIEPDGGDGAAFARAIRTLAEHAGGYATLVRAGNHGRDVAAFHPQAAPLARLSAALKASLDPAGILNPGRMA